MKNLKHFVLDECDKMLEQLGKSLFLLECLKTMMPFTIDPSDQNEANPRLSLPPHNHMLQAIPIPVVQFSQLLTLPPDMRRDVQEIFRATPHEKQVMMFSATLSKEIRPVCKKFMQDVSSAQNYQTSHPSVGG